MPDPSGFLNFQRQLPPLRPVSDRVRDFRDVYQRADDKLIREQATRCMNCGIPYCHEGCPLANLIPDFNDLVRTGDWERAAEVLHSTNNFPELTGRLCPALCEGSCTVGLKDKSVTIKQVEVEIADRAFKEGWVVPSPAATPSGRSVAVIGSGPAGLAAAQQLARAGHAVTVYERSDAVGGFMRYGIPDFKLEKHIIDDRMAQLTAEGVRFVTGCEVGVDVPVEQVRASHDAVLITCGALERRDMAGTPGRKLGGIHQALDYLIGANRVVSGALQAPPITAEGKHVIVVGGGDTAADCLGTAIRHGAASVNLIEMVPQPPLERDPMRNPWPTWPMILRTGSAHEEGGTRIYGASVHEFIPAASGDVVGSVRVSDVTVSTVGGFTVTPVEGTERIMPADLVLLAIGFTGAEASPMLDQFGLTRNRRGTIDCGSDWQTDVPGVFVAGDARRGPSLIVWAIAEGRSVAASVHRFLGGAGNLPAPVTPGSLPLMVR